jgi:uncharacterized protein YecE (DUF72 family)
MPAKEMLGFYGERFRTVEINNTFYRMPKASLLETWAASVPDQFKFVLKAPQQITNFQWLEDVSDSLWHFIDVAGLLKQGLVPLLFQLPPNLKKDAPRLRQFPTLLPDHCRVALEFRHRSWFDSEVFDALRERAAVLCVAEAENELEIPCVSTADWGYLRLRWPDYGDAELKAWIDRLREQGWRNVFVFFKHEDEGKAPLMAKRFLELASR